MAKSDRIKSSDLLEDRLFVPQKKDVRDLREEVDKLILGFKTLQKVGIKNLKSLKTPTNSKEYREVNTALEKQTATRKALTQATKDSIIIKKQAEDLKQKEIRTTILLRKEQERQIKIKERSIKTIKRELEPMRKLERATNTAQRRFKNLAVAQGLNSKATRIAEKRFQALDGRLRQINKVARDGRRDVGRYHLAFQKLGGSLRGGLGALGITAGLYGLVRVIGNTVNIFKDFEKANSNLRAVLGATDDEMALLSQQAKDLGAVTAFTATEVAGLQTEFAKLGFPTSDIQLMTESTLNASSAMGSDLAETAKLTGATLKAFGLQAHEAQRVNDVLARSTSASALDFEKLSGSMSTIAPVANSFGFSLEGTVALLGELSNAGFDASSGATATRNILLNLADTNGKLAKSLKEPVTDIPSLVRGLKQLKDDGIDLGEALELTDKRSVAAFSTFLEGTDSVIKLNEELEKAGGTAQTMADTQLDNLSGAVTILNSAWEGFVLSLEDGEGAFSRVLRSATEGITDILTALKSLNDFGEILSRATLEAIDSLTDKKLETVLESITSLREKGNAEIIIQAKLTKSLENAQKDLNDALDKNISRNSGVFIALKADVDARKEALAIIQSQAKAVDEKTDADKKEAEQLDKIAIKNSKRLRDLRTENINEEERRALKSLQDKHDDQLAQEGTTAQIIIELDKKLVTDRESIAKKYAEARLKIEKNTQNELRDEHNKVKQAEITLLEANLVEFNTVEFDNDRERLEHKKRVAQMEIEIEKKKLEALERDGKTSAQDIALAQAEFAKFVFDKKKGIADEETNLRNKQTEEVLNNLSNITAFTQAELSKQASIRMAKMDEEINQNKTQLDRQRDLASQGLDNELAFREKRQRELELQKRIQAEKDAKAQEIVQLTESFFNFLNARLGENGANPTTATALAISDTLLAKATAGLLVSGLQSNYDGTEDTGIGGNIDSKGGFIAVQHPNERVMTAKQNKRLNGISNEKLAEVGENYMSGAMYLPNQMFAEAGTSLSEQQSQADLSAITMMQNEDIKSLLKKINEKEVQRVEFDKFGNMVETIMEGRMKTVITHKTRNRKRL